VRLTPSDYNISYELIRELNHEYGLALGIRRLLELTGNKLIHECVTAEDKQDLATLHRLAASPARECAAIALLRSNQANNSEFATVRAMAARSYGLYAALLIADRLRAGGHARDADAVLANAMKLPQTVHARLVLAKRAASSVEFQRAVDRSDYPAVRFWRTVDDLSKEGRPERAFELEAAAYYAESYGAFSDCGHVMASAMAAWIDHGDMVNARRVAPHATICADRSPNLELQARIRIWHARALVKAGSPRAAIPLLRAAEPIAKRSSFTYN